MKKTLFILFIFIFLILLNTNIFAVSDSVDINLQVIEDSKNLSGGWGPVIFNIKNVLTSDITTNSAKISWLTTKSSFCNFYWGNTLDYEKESIFETTENTEHFVVLDKLRQSSNYYYKITCQTNNLEKDQILEQQFKTLLIINNIIFLIFCQF